MDERVYSQTLDRGVRILQALAASEHPLSVASVAARLGVHRSIAYRIVRTLESHRLVERDEAGRYSPGLGLSALARTVRRNLQSAALPEMSDVANELAMTTFLGVPDQGEVVTVASVEPRHSRVHVAYSPGIRHSVHRGAPGLALLAGAPPRADEREDVTLARERGWASSYQEVLPGMRSVATPIRTGEHEAIGTIAVVYVDVGRDPARLGGRLVEAARAIRAELTT
ncbi:MAG: IclR family transcriptional regulator [Nocardioidaceae bacterium]